MALLYVIFTHKTLAAAAKFLIKMVGAVFVRFVGADNGKPVDLPILGWQFSHDKEQVDVMRRDGESDEELERRALAMARQHMPAGQAIPRLVQIHG